MSQHKSSLKRTLRSALKHKKAADAILDSMVVLEASVISVKGKIAADTNGTWGTDYETSSSVSEVDFDQKGSEQHKASLRKVIISSLAHKRLANEIVDAIEEAQVTFNAILVKMDAGAGTLDPVDANWDELLIGVKIDNDSKGTDAQHKASLRESMRKAVSHKFLADFILDGIFVMQVSVESIITDIKAKN